MLVRLFMARGLRTADTPEPPSASSPPEAPVVTPLEGTRQDPPRTEEQGSAGALDPAPPRPDSGLLWITSEVMDALPPMELSGSLTDVAASSPFSHDTLAAPLRMERSAPPPLPSREESHLRLVCPVIPGDRLDESSAEPTVAAEPLLDAEPGRAFGTNPPAGAAPRPASEGSFDALVADFTPSLRREESVLEEAELLRAHPLHRASASWGRAQSAAFTLASRLGATAVRLLRRFETLPRRQQLLYVAAPYAAALGLLMLMVSAPADDRAIVPLPATANLVDLPPEPSPDTPLDAAPEPASAPKEAFPLEEAPAKAGEAQPAAAPLRSWTTRLSRRARLFVRADTRSRRPIRLRKGILLTVYPDFPAPVGWRLVQTRKGTVGFVSALHLNAPDAPARAGG